MCSLTFTVKDTTCNATGKCDQSCTEVGKIIVDEYIVNLEVENGIVKTTKCEKNLNKNLRASNREASFWVQICFGKLHLCVTNRFLVGSVFVDYDGFFLFFL